MKAEQLVQDISKAFGSMTSEEDKLLGYKKITEPKMGDIVYYKDNRDQYGYDENHKWVLQHKASKEFRKVMVIGGNYLDSTYGRVSNFWYWKEVDDNGNISEEIRHGYGNFYGLA